MGKPTILVVEDNPKNIRRVESILGEDYNLRITNLDDAVKILNGEKGIDLILANILQKDHGREDDRDTALIKKAKSTKSKLVVISDAEEGFSHVEALIRGVDGYASLFGYRSKRGLASIVESALNAEEQERQLEMKLSPRGNLESILVINNNPVVAEELQKHYEGKYEILHADDAKLAKRIMNRRNVHAAIIDTSLLDEKKIADIEKKLRIHSEQRSEKCQIVTYGPTPKDKGLVMSYIGGLMTHMTRFKTGGLKKRLLGLIKSQIEPHTEIRELKSQVKIFEKISHNYVLKQAYEILEAIESEVGQRHLSKGIDAEFVETFSDQLLEARHIIEHVFQEKEKLTGKIKIILRDDFED
ncbi:hypothetical protein KY339_04480, partial [Candidatus Woesearchaeota archaeon]|nr:hypothetical protein [Candidatus Woesearchaeota archaeon]